MVEIIPQFSAVRASTFSLHAHVTDHARATAQTNATSAVTSSVTSYVSNVVITIVIAVLGVVGVVGNLLTLCAIARTRALRTNYNLFIFSLSCSDLFSAAFCSPLWLYRRTWGFHRWSWGSFLCKLYWVSDFWTNYATALHIFSFAIFRYVTIRKPSHGGGSLSAAKMRPRVIGYLVLLWVLALITALPLIQQMGVKPADDDAAQGGVWPSCSIVMIREFQIYIYVVFPVVYYVPEAVIVTLYVLISRIIFTHNRKMTRLSTFNAATPRFHDVKPHPSPVTSSANSKADAGSLHLATLSSRAADKARTRRSSNSTPTGERARRQRPVSVAQKRELNRDRMNTQVFAQGLMIVVSFLLGYVPNSVYQFWTTNATVTGTSEPHADYWYGVASYVCQRASECLNPAAYNLGSSNLRRATGALLSDVRSAATGCCRRKARDP